MITGIHQKGTCVIERETKRWFARYTYQQVIAYLKCLAHLGETRCTDFINTPVHKYPNFFFMSSSLEPTTRFEAVLRHGQDTVGKLRSSFRDRADPMERLLRLEEEERKQEIRENLLASASSSSSYQRSASGLHRVHLSTAYSTPPHSQEADIIGKGPKSLSATHHFAHHAVVPVATSHSLLDSVFNASYQLLDKDGHNVRRCLSPTLSPNNSRPGSITFLPSHMNSPNGSRQPGSLNALTTISSTGSRPGSSGSSQLDSYQSPMPQPLMKSSPHSPSSQINSPPTGIALPPMFKVPIRGGGFKASDAPNRQHHHGVEDDLSDDGDASLIAELDIRDSPPSPAAAQALRSAFGSTFKRSISSLRPASDTSIRPASGGLLCSNNNGNNDPGQGNHLSVDIEAGTAGEQMMSANSISSRLLLKSMTSVRPSSLNALTESMHGHALLARGPSSPLSPNSSNHREQQCNASGSGSGRGDSPSPVSEEVERRRFQRGLSLSVFSRGASRNL